MSISNYDEPVNNIQERDITPRLEGEIGIISPDRFSQQRFQALSRANSDIHKEAPFCRGLLLTGSLSKGKELTRETASLPDSDVDVVIVLDHDDLETNLRQYLSIPEFKRNFMQENARGSERVYALRTAATKYIEAAAQRIIGTRNALVEYHPKVELTTRYYSTEGDYSIAALTENPDTEMKELALPFAYDLGGVMGQARSAFADYLQGLEPQAAEQTWQRVKEAITFWEKGVKSNITESNMQTILSQIPQTAYEAITFYRQEYNPQKKQN